MKISMLMPALSLLILSGCSAIKNMDAMKEKTDEMSAVMKGMASDVRETKDTSKGMAVDVRETKETSQSMESKVSTTNATALATYMDLRSKDSADARIKFMEKLKEAQTLEEKIVWASMYMQAFEFQLWKDQSLDDAHARELFMAQAITEFFRQLSGLIKEDYIRPGKPVLGQSSEDNEFLTLSAIAVALHRVNHSQEVVKERTGAQPKSLYSIITRGLKYKWAVYAGNKTPEQIPEYARQVLYYEPVAAYLLQLRHNTFGRMAIGKLLGLNARPGFEAKTALAALPKKFIEWQADLNRLNEVQLWEINRWLREAIKTRETMVTIGVAPEFDSTISQIAGNMQTNEVTLKLETLSPARRAYVKELVASFEAFRK